MTTLLLLAMGCPRYSSPEPPGPDTGLDSADTGDTGDTAEATPLTFTFEAVAQGAIADLVEARSALRSPTNGFTYVAEADGFAVRYIQDSYVYPTGDWCVGGYDDEGVCVRTVTAGRILADKPTTDLCLDADVGRMFLVKEAGVRLEVVDLGPEGEKPYTYNDVETNPTLPTTSGTLNGPCAWMADAGFLAMGTAEGGLAMLEIGEEETVLVAAGTLPLVAERLFAVDRGAELVAEAGGRIVRVSPSTGTTPFDYTLAGPISDLAVGDDGTAWLAMGTVGAARLDTTNAQGQPVPLPVDGDVRHVAIDETNGVTWFAAEADGAWTLSLVQDDEVRATLALDVAVQALAAPSDDGDLVVVGLDADGIGAFRAFGLVPDRVDLPPLNVYLFTTIEEPSDANMANPCSGAGDTFEGELAYVRSNASQLAGLGIPIALAISDNFAEKAEECGETAIFAELQSMGFELGVMLHNRPCYNCTASATDSNADYCASSHPFFIGSSSTAACFPDDPEYCGLGDYPCYEAFLQPRVEIADRNIPGGGAFIVGADRHGMWDYDWLRLYQEVERTTMGRQGFDITMFVATWAYEEVNYDDPRGKNPAPWRPQKRAAAWRPGDIESWDQDSAWSSILYLPGTNSATVKIAEQQRSGLNMLDFFDIGVAQYYEPEDFDVTWAYMRQALAYRRADSLNVWNFHVQDLGTGNLTNPDMEPLEIDGVPVINHLQDFVDRVNARYVPTGEVVWAYPSAIGAQYEEPWE